MMDAGSGSKGLQNNSIFKLQGCDSQMENNFLSQFGSQINGCSLPTMFNLSQSNMHHGISNSNLNTNMSSNTNLNYPNNSLHLFGRGNQSNLMNQTSQLLNLSYMIDGDRTNGLGIQMIDSNTFLKSMTNQMDQSLNNNQIQQNQLKENMMKGSANGLAFSSHAVQTAKIKQMNPNEISPYFLPNNMQSSQNSNNLPFVLQNRMFDPQQMLQMTSQPLFILDKAKQLSNSTNLIKIKAENKKKGTNSKNLQLKPKNELFESVMKFRESKSPNENNHNYNCSSHNFQGEWESIENECKQYVSAIAFIKEEILKTEEEIISTNNLNKEESLNDYQENTILELFDKSRAYLKCYLEDLIWEFSKPLLEYQTFEENIPKEYIEKMKNESFKQENSFKEVKRNLREFSEQLKEFQNTFQKEEKKQMCSFWMSDSKKEQKFEQSQIIDEDKQAHSQILAFSISDKQFNCGNSSSLIRQSWIHKLKSTLINSTELELGFEEDEKFLYFGYLNKITKSKEGRGIMFTQNSTLVQGYFYKDKPCGEARIFYKTGNQYKGLLEEGQHHGQGKYTLANGDIYEGSFIKGRRSGKGKYIWKDGRMLDGNWKDEVPHGYGEYDSCVLNEESSGDFNMKTFEIFKGNWKNNHKEGKGILYVGILAEWKNNQIVSY